MERFNNLQVCIYIYLYIKKIIYMHDIYIKYKKNRKPRYVSCVLLNMLWKFCIIDDEDALYSGRYHGDK